MYVLVLHFLAWLGYLVWRLKYRKKSHDECWRCPIILLFCKLILCEIWCVCVLILILCALLAVCQYYYYYYQDRKIYIWEKFLKCEDRGHCYIHSWIGLMNQFWMVYGDVVLEWEKTNMEKFNPWHEKVMFLTLQINSL